MKAFELSGKLRTETGKKASKSLRKQGFIPCELYGKKGNVHFYVSNLDVRDLIYSPEFKTVNVELEGKQYECILKDVQYHSLYDHIEHIDFLELSEGSKVRIEVPVNFKGTSPGVRSGGKLIQKVRKVKVRLKPEDLIDQVILDISNINLGQSVRVKDIQVKEGVEILNNPGIPLASVEVPRLLKSAAAGEEETEEVEGEESTGEEETPAQESE